MSKSSEDNKLSVFVSYAHEDKRLRDRLEKHLTILKFLGLINTWDSQQVLAGREWAAEISLHLEQADIVLLLISPDFLASNYCSDTEMRRVMGAGRSVVIPILLRPVVWEGSLFDSPRVLPRNKKPVTSWRNYDEAFVDIVQGMKEVLSSIYDRPRMISHPIEDILRYFPDEKSYYLDAIYTYVKELARNRRDARLHLFIGDALTAIIAGHGDIYINEVPDEGFGRFSLKDILHLKNILDKYHKYQHAFWGRLKERWLGESKTYKLSALALNAYNRSIDLQPHLVDAYSGKGKLLFQLERLDESLQVYTEVLDTDFVNPYIYYSYSLILGKVERHEEAAIAYQKAVQLNAHIASIYQDWEYSLAETESDK